MTRWRLIGALCIGMVGPGNTQADEIRVAVASNFVIAATAIVDDFQQQTGHRVLLAAGSTGKHFAQITHGAPFDLFLAADSERPKRLEEMGLARQRFTYALGRLVLWSRDPLMIVDASEVLRSGRFRHLAMANPKLAPYGRAAREVLESKGLWLELQPRLVTGENIAQTLQFVATGNAEMGFVARSQILGSDRFFGVGSLWEVPAELHHPIEQQAVLLSDAAAAAALMQHLNSSPVRAMIRDHGYALP